MDKEKAEFVIQALKDGELVSLGDLGLLCEYLDIDLQHLKAYLEKNAATVIDKHLQMNKVDWLDKQKLISQLSNTARRFIDEVDLSFLSGSTNTVLLNESVQLRGAKRKLLITELQLNGRGRGAKEWYAPVGRSIAMSLRIRAKDIPVGCLAHIPYLVGLSVVEALSQRYKAQMSLKWPNDILLNGKKAGGILIEKKGAVLVIGLGLNLSIRESESIRFDLDSTGLWDEHKCSSDKNRKENAVDADTMLSREIMIGEIVNVLTEFLVNINDANMPNMIKRWNALHAWQGKEVDIIQLADGSSTRGIAEGIDDQGRFCLSVTGYEIGSKANSDTIGEKRYFTAGEVRLSSNASAS